MPLPPLYEDAQKTLTVFEKMGKQLTGLNGLLETFSKTMGTAAKIYTGAGGTSGSGGVGNGNGIPLGTNNATFSIGTAMATMGIPGGAAVKIAGGVAAGIGAAMPDMGQTMGRAQGYYNAAIYSGVKNRALMSQTTLRALGNGLTSPGSDAAASQIMTQAGIMYSSSSNSQYMQNMRNVSNSAQLYGISNEQAASSLAGLSAGPTSGMLMASQGIMTSEAGTGKELSEQQIFEQFYQRSTAGRGPATLKQTMDSLHRGFLGQSIANSGLDQTEQRKLAQYYIAKAGGKTVDLGDNTSTQKLLDENAKNGNANPMRGVYKQNQIDTRQMGKSEGGFIGGLEAATNALEGFNDIIGTIVSNFSGIQGFAQQAGSMKSVQGVIAGVKTTVGLGGGTSPGIASSSNLGFSSGTSFGAKGGTGGTASAAPTTGSSSTSNNGSLKMIHPIPGASINLRFNVKDKIHTNGHTGIDYQAKEGTAVHAAADGKVTVNGGPVKTNTMGTSNHSFGQQVHIDHGNGVVSIYGHLSVANAGSTVKQGDLIGLSGNTGYSNGPHLHFEVQENGKPVNPEKYLGATNSDAVSNSGTSSASGSSGNTAYLSTSTPSGSVSTGISGVSGSVTSISEQLSSYSTPSGIGGGESTGIQGTSALVSGYTGSNGYDTAGIGGKLSGSKSKNNVTINLTIAQASDSEAHAFATRVKKLLEEDNLMTNMGRL